MMYKTLALGLLGLFLVACGGDNDNADATGGTALEHAQRHADSSYVCPMHPQVVSDSPGDCPICGMDLVERSVDEQAHAGHTEPMADAMNDTVIEHGQEHADPTYVCPMHPQVVSDTPGECPICGMDLVAQKPQDQQAAAPVIRLGGTMQHNLALRTAPVIRERLWRRIDTYGEIGFNENARHMVHVRAPGWVEAIDVRSEGERVAAGDQLFALYSPQLVAAQEEYRLARRRHGPDHPQSEAAAERLRQLDVPQDLVDQLRAGGEVRRQVPVYAPRDGVVGAIHIRHGHYLTPDQVAYELVDLETVWLEARVPQGRAEWLDQARWVEARIPGLSGRLWESEVEYLYPDIDPVSRSLRVRVPLDNGDGMLRPGMLADVTVFGGAKNNALSVPAAAVIRSGDGARVVKVLDEERFQSVVVETGIRVGDRVEILAGLSEGEQVVERGQFLLDSESSLRGGLPASAHNH